MLLYALCNVLAMFSGVATVCIFQSSPSKEDEPCPAGGTWPTLIRLLRRGICLAAESGPVFSHFGDSQRGSFWTFLPVFGTLQFPFDTGSPRCVSRLVPAPPDAALQPATGGATALLLSPNSAMVSLLFLNVLSSHESSRAPERHSDTHRHSRAIVLRVRSATVRQKQRKLLPRSLARSFFFSHTRARRGGRRQEGQR